MDPALNASALLQAMPTGVNALGARPRTEAFPNDLVWLSGGSKLSRLGNPPPAFLLARHTTARDTATSYGPLACRYGRAKSVAENSRLRAGTCGAQPAGRETFALAETQNRPSPRRVLHVGLRPETLTATGEVVGAGIRLAMSSSAFPVILAPERAPMSLSTSWSRRRFWAVSSSLVSRCTTSTASVTTTGPRTSSCGRARSRRGSE